jgi:RNA polymerase sigma-70 factor, ECF subfamily
LLALKLAMTVREDSAALEARIRAHCEEAELRHATTLLLQGYGRELLGFLIARLRDRDAAGEVFSRFTEDLWRGIADFRWQCSARVWAYTLARHAASRYLHETRRRRVVQLPLSVAGPLSGIAEQIRTSTLHSLRTETKSQLRLLRERLPLDDQTLLVLRVNRGLAWTEIAQVMLHEGEVADRDLLEKGAARLRKRYQVAREKLRAMAEAAGLGPRAKG